ncbi:RICIN domain-containing protein [Kineosporia sp. NBRC 101731]|uniref:RICIN domain-containing protein n=1 Tax=Kineosporia sp. NBRC 101731 TaxID=3032199 RepID=UPI00331B1E1F
MDVRNAGKSNGTAVQAYDCNGTGAQTWVYSTTNKSLRNPNSNRCLDGNNMATGKGLYIWDCNGTSAQRWVPFRADSTGRSPGYRNPDSGKCIDANDRRNGRQFIVYPCNYSLAQWWGMGLYSAYPSSISSPTTT